MGRRPRKLDRAYFEKKKNPKYDDKDALTICCGESKNDDGLRKDNKNDTSNYNNNTKTIQTI